MTHESRGSATRHEHSHDAGHDHEHGHSHGFTAAVRELFIPHSHDAADSIDGALESSAAVDAVGCVVAVRNEQLADGCRQPVAMVMAMRVAGDVAVFMAGC